MNISATRYVTKATRHDRGGSSDRGVDVVEKNFQAGNNVVIEE